MKKGDLNGAYKHCEIIYNEYERHPTKTVLRVYSEKSHQVLENLKILQQNLIREKKMQEMMLKEQQMKEEKENRMTYEDSDFCCDVEEDEKRSKNKNIEYYTSRINSRR
mmetsp:Transcript_43077/g.41424  ORF Transcript_43077/g.41424 Transcript_43077/m.41424 type:complete len:109 (+) Transcript_43077:3-329(+)